MIATYVECDAAGCDQRAQLSTNPIHTAALLPPSWLYVALPDLEEWYEAPRPRYFCSPQCVIAYQADLLEVERLARQELDGPTLADVSPEDAADQEQADRDLDHLDGL